MSQKIQFCHFLATSFRNSVVENPYLNSFNFTSAVGVVTNTMDDDGNNEGDKSFQLNHLLRDPSNALKPNL